MTDVGTTTTSDDESDIQPHSPVVNAEGVLGALGVRQALSAERKQETCQEVGLAD